MSADRPGDDALRRAADLAIAYLQGVDDRPVGPPVDPAALRAALGGPLPAAGEDPAAVVEALARAAEPGIVGSAGGRYFGFVIGGSLPAALGADWLTSAWDQNAALYACGPAAAVAEAVVGEWVVDLLGLPSGSAAGLVTGATMASLACLAAARQAVLRDAGWDLGADGLAGSPPLTVVVGAEAHASVLVALRILGVGARQLVTVPVDGQGRMRADALAAAVADARGPCIVCVQAGHIGTGAFDPLPAAVDAARAHGAWLHVDGAFGLWARAAPALRHLAEGVEGADSWATDAHKWLNVPYDCGLAIVRQPAELEAAMGIAAAYLARPPEGGHDPSAWVPELSRRARGFPAWAALRSLGRDGVAELVARTCALAARFAARLEAADGVRVCNDVVLNQALVRFEGPDEAAGDDLTRRVVLHVQRDGTAWLGGTVWQGRAVMRVSVSSWRTTADDVDRSADAVLAALAAERG